MKNLYQVSALVFGGLLIYGFRVRILDRLRRINQRNIARQRQEAEDRRDRFAHYKHTLSLAAEQVEEIGEIKVPDERTGDPVTRYLFEGETFASRDEAEAARNEKIVAKAREFYMELPAALAARGNGKLRN
ncbi:MAG: hypothetical protein ABSC92_11820 [Rhizomicrobium sp.]|jgi:hypothetical protein